MDIRFNIIKNPTTEKGEVLKGYGVNLIYRELKKGQEFVVPVFIDEKDFESFSKTSDGGLSKLFDIINFQFRILDEKLNKQ